MNSWLEWKRSAEEILPSYYSEINKKALILESLNTMDKEACILLPYKDIQKYLHDKYDDIILVDHTLEDITKIKKAINDDQTYQNHNFHSFGIWRQQQ